MNASYLPLVTVHDGCLYLHPFETSDLIVKTGRGRELVALDHTHKGEPN